MSDKVTLKINDVDVTVPRGTTVIEAARTIGVEIPHFCYHPSLELVGSCRMCQVEFTAGGRSFLGVSCRTEAADGMEVDTHSEAAVRARAGVLEFLLANHPLDCPICDEAGECDLQDTAYAHGFTDGRFKEERRKSVKKTPLGGHIVYDAERCILCTRCVRFMEQYAKAAQLDVFGRGDESIISVFPGQELDSSYTGNIADLCPVGALTIEDFRFACRVWNLASAPSICPYCSRGCNIRIDVREGKNRILRIMPRDNPDVNRGFICNEGRFRPLGLNDEKRLESPLIKGSPGTMEKALEEAARGLADFKDRLLVVASVQRTTEEIYLVRQAFAGLAGEDRIVALEPPREEPDGILRTGELGANAAACRALGLKMVSTAELDALLADGSVEALFLADPSLAIAPELRKILRFIVVLGHVASDAAASADIALPGLAWVEKEGTFINCDGRVQRLTRGRSGPSPSILPDLMTLARLCRLLDRGEMPDQAGSVFDEMAGKTPALSSLRYSDLGDGGAVIPLEKEEE